MAVSSIIRQAHITDLNAAYVVISAAHAKLASVGFTHWEYYTVDKLREIINLGELYVMVAEMTIIGTIRISKNPPDYFANTWAGYPEAPEQCIYIGTVGIHPVWQGKGLSSKLMTYAENMAALWGRNVARLDTRTEVPDLINRYLGWGYQQLITIPEEEGESYTLMQKYLAA